MNQQPERLAKQSRAAMALYLTAGMAQRVEHAHLGPDEIGRHSLSSPFVIKTFLKQYPGVASDFLVRAGIDADTLLRAIDLPDEPEAQPKPLTLSENPTEDQRKVYEIMKELEDNRRAKGEPEPFTLPLKMALASARGVATEMGDETYGVCALVSSIFATESIARDALLGVADPTKVDEALQWLRVQADPDDGPNLMEANKVHMREALDRMWPKIREASSERNKEAILAARDRKYEENPDLYEKPLDIAQHLSRQGPDADDDYSRRAGVCLLAARNEARIRRAKECTLDHMLVALVRDGTDTAAFLDRHNIDRTKWAARLNDLLPRAEEGPRWPPDDRALGMSFPSNVRYEFKPLPEGVDIESLSPEERKEAVTRVVDANRKFTDLVMLRKIHEEPQTFAFQLFDEAGITADELKAEIRARETRNSD